MRVLGLSESHRFVRHTASALASLPLSAVLLWPALVHAGEANVALAQTAVAQAAVAQAEPEPALGAARPSIDVSVAPPPAPVQRTYQVHEGFYLRADVGLGTFSSTVSADGAPADVESSGMDLELDLLVGGGLSPGLTLGGGLLYGAQISGDWEVNDTQVASGDLSTLLIGPFIDGFPNANGGWHFGGLAGLSRATFDVGDSESALGFGGAVWGGHDFWVAPDWSVGGLLRIAAIRATKDEVTATKLSFSLAFTALMN